MGFRDGDANGAEKRSSKSSRKGDQREVVFRDDENRQRFLETLGEACGKTEWQVHAGITTGVRRCRLI
jgi:hypothetical protein